MVHTMLAVVCASPDGNALAHPSFFSGVGVDLPSAELSVLWTDVDAGIICPGMCGGVGSSLPRAVTLSNMWYWIHATRYWMFFFVFLMLKVSLSVLGRTPES